MLTIKDKDKRNYIYNYVCFLTLPNVTIQSWNQQAQILNYPLKTNLCPKRIVAKIQCGVDFNITGTTTGSGNYALQAMCQGFFITVLGQKLFVNPGNSEYSYEIDPHYWPTLQDYSTQPNSLIQISTNVNDNQFFQIGGGGNTGFFTANNAIVQVFVQLIISE